MNHIYMNIWNILYLKLSFSSNWRYVFFYFKFYVSFHMNKIMNIFIIKLTKKFQNTQSKTIIALLSLVKLCSKHKLNSKFENEIIPILNSNLEMMNYFNNITDLEIFFCFYSTIFEKSSRTAYFLDKSKIF